MTGQFLRARIDRILKRFTPTTENQLPEDYQEYISEMFDAPAVGIDDGAVYEPQERTTPDWVQRDLTGWV
jgi:hypothetical protein